jgi:hypothetical protein
MPKLQMTDAAVRRVTGADRLFRRAPAGPAARPGAARLGVQGCGWQPQGKGRTSLMFAPKIAKALTKAPDSPTRQLAPQLQRTIGNQATLRYLMQRFSNLPHRSLRSGTNKRPPRRTSRPEGHRVAPRGISARSQYFRLAGQPELKCDPHSAHCLCMVSYSRNSLPETSTILSSTRPTASQTT